MDGAGLPDVGGIIFFGSFIRLCVHMCKHARAEAFFDRLALDFWLYTDALMSW